MGEKSLCPWVAALKFKHSYRKNYANKRIKNKAGEKGQPEGWRGAGMGEPKTIKWCLQIALLLYGNGKSRFQGEFLCFYKATVPIIVRQHTRTLYTQSGECCRITLRNSLSHSDTKKNCESCSELMGKSHKRLWQSWKLIRSVLRPQRVRSAERGVCVAQSDGGFWTPACAFLHVFQGVTGIKHEVWYLSKPVSSDLGRIFRHHPMPIISKCLKLDRLNQPIALPSVDNISMWLWELMSNKSLRGHHMNYTFFESNT